MRPKDIITLVKQAQVDAIEWGGDVHVPHGDVAKAKEVARMTHDAGLKVAAYGSYYRVGCEGRGSPPFQDVLDTAVALEAETIRVWAGDRGSKSAHDSWWNLVVRETRRIAELAQQAGLSISFEFHGNTLNDNADGARRLFRSVEHDNVFSYWQPDINLSIAGRYRGLKQLRRRLSNIHVFNWLEGDRKPLGDATDEWQQYFWLVTETGRDHYALLEFVQDNMPPYFLRDAESLITILKRVGAY
jgi:sugar phosphate isomerase/epimerase